MAKWHPEKQYDLYLKLLTFIVSPFLSLVYSLTRSKTRSTLVVFFLFCIFYGMSFTIQSGKDEVIKSDAAVFRLAFEENVAPMSESDYVKEVKLILQRRAYYKDLYFISVAFLVSRFSYNYHHLFFAFAIVFGLFMTLSLKVLVKNENYDGKLLCLFLVGLFTTNFIFNINGMRFWTAAWVANYALLKVMAEDKKWYLALLILTPYIHASFYYVWVVCLIYYFASDKKSRWINLYYVSFFFSGISTFIVSAVIGNIPAFERYLAYVGEDSMSRMFERQSMARIIFDIISIIYINTLFYLVFLKNKRGEEIKAKRLYDFFLVYITLNNFLIFVPSLGPRFFVIGFPFITYLWLANFGTYKYKWLIYIMPLTMLWRVHNSYLLFTRFVESNFYWSNPAELIIEYFTSIFYQA